MPVSFAQFEATVSDYIAKKIDPAPRQFQVEFGKELASRIVQRTPVRTGLARGNTRFSRGSRRATKPLPTPDPGGQATINRIHQGLDTLGNGAAGWAIYTVLHYSKYLEQGSSQQAPLGMYRISLVEMLLRRDEISRRVQEQLGTFNAR